MSAVKFLLTLLFFPVLLILWLGWIIYWKLYGKKQAKREQKRQEFKQKLLTHIKNFSPTRLKNKSWQKRVKTRRRKKRHYSRKTKKNKHVWIEKDSKK